MNNSKRFAYLGLICLVLSVVLMIRYIFPGVAMKLYSASSYFEYFLNYRIPDFITQLMLVILSIYFFVKYLISVDKSDIVIVASLWCIVGALASLLFSIRAYFQSPHTWYIYPGNYYGSLRLPGLLSLLVLLGTSIFFFIARKYTEKKSLRPKFAKKASLVEPKIDSDTRKNILEKISTSNLKDLINSLNCVKCDSNVAVSISKVSFGRRSCEVPMCDKCSGLYNRWYSTHKITDRITPRVLYCTFPLLILMTIIFLKRLLVFSFFVPIIVNIVIIVKFKLDHSEQGSPFKNIKIKLGNRVLVKPDNFKKWTSLQDWVLYNLEIEESGEIQLTEIETIFLNYLNENKGSAFTPRALVKRSIGENFTEEYVEVINKLLKKMTEKGIISSDYNNGIIHYFSS